MSEPPQQIEYHLPCPRGHQGFFICIEQHNDVRWDLYWCSACDDSFTNPPDMKQHRLPRMAVMMPGGNSSYQAAEMLKQLTEDQPQ